MQNDRKIYTSRPEKLLDCDQKEIYDCLEKLGLEFERMDRIESDNVDENVYKILGIRRLKNLLLCNASRTNFYLLIMTADVPFKSAVLSAQLGTSRFKFAPEEYLKELIHAKPGTSSILGLIFDKEKKVQLLIDELVLEQKYFGCLPCCDDTSLKFDTKQLLEKLLEYTGHAYTVVKMQANS